MPHSARSCFHILKLLAALRTNRPFTRAECWASPDRSVAVYPRLSPWSHAYPDSSFCSRRARALLFLKPALRLSVFPRRASEAAIHFHRCDRIRCVFLGNQAACSVRGQCSIFIPRRIGYLLRRHWSALCSTLRAVTPDCSRGRRPRLCEIWPRARPAGVNAPGYNPSRTKMDGSTLTRKAMPRAAWRAEARRSIATSLSTFAPGSRRRCCAQDSGSCRRAVTRR